MENNQVFLNLPTRAQKPREDGLTMLIDSGLGLRRIQDVLEVSANNVDYVKLGWGTSLITPNLADKVALYQKFGIPVCLGGTLFELSFLQNKVDDFLIFADKFKVDLIEVSDGTIYMEEEDKLEQIRKISKNYKVLSEFGSKDDQLLKAPHLWVKGMIAELEAGAWKVIAEGRESGTAGMYRGSSELRTGLVQELVDHIPQEKIIWEAPKKSQQAWFVKQFGTNVNLGNISYKDLIALETLRLGLRGDTLLHFHENK